MAIDAGRDDERVTADLERPAERRQHAPRHDDRLEVVLELLEHDRELVAPHAAHNVADADGVAQSPGDLRQQPVAALVPDAVVEVAEGVDVDEQHTDIGSRAVATLQCPRQLVCEDLSVGQRRQRVATDAVLEAQPFGDVLGGGVPVVPVGAATPKQRTAAAVAVAVACQQFREAGLPSAGDISLAGRGGRIVGVQAVEQRRAEQFARRTSEHTRAGIVDGDEAALAVEDREHAAGVGEELLEGLQAELGARHDR